MSSRNIKDEEKNDFTAKGHEIQDWVAAYDMIGVIVNESNQLGNLTLSQVEGIFTGDITDWSEVGRAPPARFPSTPATPPPAPTRVFRRWQ